MRISDWSSDVCSSDLEPAAPPPVPDSVPKPPAPRPPGRWSGCLPWAILLLVLLLGLLIWKFPDFKAQAEVGSAYAARVGCSCRYVEGRSLESCQTDSEPGMEMASCSEDSSTNTITGRVPPHASIG